MKHSGVADHGAAASHTDHRYDSGREFCADYYDGVALLFPGFPKPDLINALHFSGVFFRFASYHYCVSAQHLSRHGDRM